jgi:hypothetical protein
MQDQLSGPADDIAAARQVWILRIAAIAQENPELAMGLEDELQRRLNKHRDWVQFWREQRMRREVEARRLRLFWKANPDHGLTPNLLQSGPQAGREKESSINKM